MYKVPGKIKIPYVLVEKFERPLNIPKRPSIENIGILYNYGPGVRGMNAQRLLVQSENTRTFVRTSIERFSERQSFAAGRLHLLINICLSISEFFILWTLCSTFVNQLSFRAYSWLSICFQDNGFD